MKCIETELIVTYREIVIVHDGINAVAHLKVGKSDGSEGLFSDHFLNGTKHLHLFLSLLFTLFLVHDFSPDSMILGAMIPIQRIRRSHSVIRVTTGQLR